VNIKEYIESGILEAYVLGALDAAERAEVERYIALYPEVAEEVAAIERAMQSYAEANAEEVPAHMQQQIWGAIQTSQTKKENGLSPKTIPLVVAENNRQYRWQNAAVLIALVGSLLVNVMLWSQRNNIEEQQVAAKQQVESLKKEQAVLAQKVDIYRKEKDMMADAALQTIPMKSVVPGHPMAATIYWNKNNGEAYLSMQKLPMPEKGKQYQMWVIQAGKPVSMGVLPMEMVSGEMVSKLPMEVKDGQAFAISLEKEGGNPTPTEVYVLGKISA
jgi:anti-sigma-K factor RskA